MIIWWLATMGSAILAVATPGPETDPAALLAAVRTYDVGQDRSAVSRLERVVSQAAPGQRRALQRALLKALARDPSPALRDVLCRALGLVGSEEAVGPLVELLRDPNSREPARFALERIGGPLVDRQLRLLLPTADDAAKVGLVMTLGARRDAEAVTMVAPLLRSDNATLAVAAAAALGRIGTVEAVATLAGAEGEVPEAVRRRILDAELEGAASLDATDGEVATAVYTRLSAAGMPAHVRVAAWRRTLLSDGTRGPAVLRALRGEDAALRAAALVEVRRLTNSTQVQTAAAFLPKLTPAEQVVLLAALGDTGQTAVVPAVTRLAREGEPAVLAAVAETLGRLGRAESVIELLRLAVGHDEPVRNAARRALDGLRGPRVDETLVKRLGAAPGEQTEILRCLAERRVHAAVPAVLPLAVSESTAVSAVARRVLERVADADDLPSLVTLLRDHPQRPYEDLVVGVLLRLGPSEQRLQPVTEALADVSLNVPTRAALLRVLGRVGDPAGLAPILAGLAAEEATLRAAAIRALALWPTPEPKERLLALAQGAPDLSSHVLALRGFVAMAVMPGRAAAEGVADLTRAWDSARRDDERRLVLSVLPKVACVEALDFALTRGRQTDLRGETQTALIGVARELVRPEPQRVRAALTRVVAAAESPTIEKQARAVLARLP